MNVDKELKELKEEPTPIEPEQVETVELELKEDVFKCSDVTVRKDMTLSSDLETYGDVYIKDGTLDLNGHTLKINGNLYEYSGWVKVNKGRLEVSGDYRLQDYVQDEETEEWSYQFSQSYLLMENVNDYVKVDGNFYVQSCTSPYYNRNCFLAGILELGGDFYQINGHGDDDNFQSGENHKVIFSGKEKQIVKFESTESYFNDVEFQNEDVEMASRIEGWTLQRDTMFKNGLPKGIDGTFDLNGHTMKVDGDFVQGSGAVKVNKGRLEVSGDYRLQDYVQDAATEEWSYQSSDSYLQMENAKDYVKVNGDFYVQSQSYNVFTAGTIELGGDFYQINGYGGNFSASETHKVILNGNKKQTINFESTSSYFNHLILTKDKETGYSFTPDNCWKTLQLASEITPHEHTEIIDKAVAATCTETGLTEGKHCPECNEILEKQEVVPELGHDYIDGICLRCGIQNNSTITKIVVSPDNITVKQGDTQKFKVIVQGNDNPSQEVTWKLIGNLSENTKISNQGLLCIGEDETAEELIVTAESKQDDTKTAQAKIKVLPKNSEIHKHIEVVDKAVAPTCIKTGLTEGKHCSECNEVLAKQKVLKALGHSYVKGVCSRCGALNTKVPIKGQKLTDQKSGAVYKVVSTELQSRTVEYTRPLSNKDVNISIPSTVKIDGISYKVTSIAANAFRNNKKITKVKIGSNITSIGKNSFSGCSKLKSLMIGNNVTSIGDSAFHNCTSIKKVTIPAKVKKIGKQAFCGCKRLKTIKINTKKLAGKFVGSKVFAKIDRKAAVKVPVSCLKSYKKLLQKKGLNGKKQKIKK